jgi:hypothetical protein
MIWILFEYPILVVSSFEFGEFICHDDLNPIGILIYHPFVFGF